MGKNSLGAFGEQYAAKYLKKQGYRIVDMNFRCRQGEIDVIAENREFLVFVEVKLRKNDLYGEAKEFVTSAKQRRIISAAELYLQKLDTEKQPRFDVIEIYAPEGADKKSIELRHIENAFY